MFVFKTRTEVEGFLKTARSQNKTIGFVPTMGALHEGHLSLLNRARQDSDLTICSIFVNPTQFNNEDDLARYPRQPEKDTELLAKDNLCDVVFLPSEQEMYPKGKTLQEPFDLGPIETMLEGKYRPGHFQGVAQVVYRLLEIVQPDLLFMGQKDFQQTMVITRLIKIKNLSVNLVVCPIKREPDGLAMSSRNTLLTEPQRAIAPLLYQCLIAIQAQKNNNSKSFKTVQKEALDLLTSKGIKPDYIALANTEDLSPLEDFNANKDMIVMIAAYIGEVRLIDNMYL